MPKTFSISVLFIVVVRLREKAFVLEEIVLPSHMLSFAMSMKRKRVYKNSLDNDLISTFAR